MSVPSSLRPTPLWIALTACTASVAGEPNGGESRELPPTVVTALAPAASLPPAALPAPVHEGPLAHFYDVLAALERGERKEHVRIAWLGDSHAQADFWTGYIRRSLQKRFGNGGPGFVHLGYKDYRHDGVEIDVAGGWRFRPKKPSTVERWGDGDFGLGGILHAGFAGERQALVELTDGALADRKLHWDLCYKLGLPYDELRLHLGGGSETIKAQGDTDVAIVRHLEKETQGLSTLKVVIVNGRPDFCGLAIETDPAEHPGVVLDNLGINGARYGTALAWNEKAWAREVQRRPPELFVFEYGGNEASDGVVKPDEYERQARELIARVQRIRPQGSCLVVGPADRADVEEKIPPIRDAMRAAADKGGCMFWDTYEVMGGRGSMRKWQDDERAAPDGIHFKPKGYAEIGALMLADLMAGYRG